MSFLSEVGLLALGSRLKSLSDRLYAEADQAYQARGSAVQGRWFPVLRLLADRGPQPVGAIAEAIGQSHSAVSQLADKLTSGGWLRAVADPADRRRRCLGLTPRAEQALREVRPTWRAMADVLGARTQGVDVLGVLDRLESVLEPSLARAFIERSAELDRAAVRVVPFAPALREHFHRLNAAWLRKYFYLEEADHQVLSHPEREILEPGGAIFFAVLGEAVVGTCGLKKESPGVYELTKMAVDESHQGLGIGRKLLAAAIAEFKRRKGRRLFLESNSRLVPALNLYRSMGFEQQPTLKPDSHYQRSDVYMIWRPPRRRARRGGRPAGAVPRNGQGLSIGGSRAKRP
jgi:ribosomal protein S18 acetylase RimI-like enzyme